MPFAATLYDRNSDAPLPRSRTHLEASITPLEKIPHHIVVHNLSTEGLLIESYHDIPVGSEVIFEIADLGKNLATVVWRDGNLYDCLFTVPLPSGPVHAKLRQGNVVWGDFPNHRAMETEALLSREGRVAPAVPGERWPLLARVAFIVGAAALCWAIPTAIVKLVWNLL